MSPLPLVIQKRLAFTAAQKKHEQDEEEQHQLAGSKGLGLDAHIDQEEEGGEEEERQVAMVSDNNTQQEDEAEEEDDDEDEESVSESVTVIDEAKLCKRLSARMVLQQEGGEQKEHQLAPEMHPQPELEQEQEDGDASIDLLASPSSSPLPSPSPRLSVVGDKTMVNTPVTTTTTQQEDEDEDEDGNEGEQAQESMSVSGGTTDLSRTVTSPPVHSRSHSQSSSQQHLYAPFYAGPQPHSFTSAPSASQSVDRHSHSRANSHAPIAGNNSNSAQHYRHPRSAQHQQGGGGGLSEKISHLSDKIEESHQGFRRHVSSTGTPFHPAQDRVAAAGPRSRDRDDISPLGIGTQLHYQRSPPSTSTNGDSSGSRRDHDLAAPDKDRDKDNVTQLRLEAITLNLSLQERTRQLESVRSELKAAQQSSQQWRRRAEEEEGLRAGAVAREEQGRQEADRLRSDIVELRLRGAAEGAKREAQTDK